MHSNGGRALDHIAACVIDHSSQGVATPVNVGQIQALRCLTIASDGLLAQFAIHHHAHQMPAGEWRIGVDCQA